MWVQWSSYEHILQISGSLASTFKLAFPVPDTTSFVVLLYGGRADVALYSPSLESGFNTGQSMQVNMDALCASISFAFYGELEQGPGDRG